MRGRRVLWDMYVVVRVPVQSQSQCCQREKVAGHFQVTGAVGGVEVGGGAESLAAGEGSTADCAAASVTALGALAASDMTDTTRG